MVWMYDYVTKHLGQQPIIVDADDLLADPGKSSFSCPFPCTKPERDQSSQSVCFGPNVAFAALPLSLFAGLSDPFTPLVFQKQHSSCIAILWELSSRLPCSAGKHLMQNCRNYFSLMVCGWRKSVSLRDLSRLHARICKKLHCPIMFRSWFRRTKCFSTDSTREDWNRCILKVQAAIEDRGCSQLFLKKKGIDVCEIV